MKGKEKQPANPARARLRRLNIGMGLALFAIVASASFVLFSHAASISNRKDVMSDQSTSTAATHEISFNLSGSNTFAAGETIAVDFPSAFTQSGTWGTSDFSFVDGTSRTISAVNAGAGVSTVSCTDGTNNVGVAVDTTGLVFRVIPCGSSFTASAAGAYITFTINGTQVSTDGKLTNPSTAGSYLINVTDGAGDCQASGDQCDMAVSIVAASDVTVQATVASSGGSGGSGSTPPPDTTPPTISGIVVSNITGSQATVSWTTNEASTSLIRYGTTTSYGSTQNDAAYVTSHSLTLTGLAQKTTYHYQVCSTDSAGNQACSTDQSFTTLDTTPPVISNVQVTNITESQATFTWTTDEVSTSHVDYDTIVGPPYGNTQGDTTYVTSHSITVTGLTASTTYHYRVRSADPSSNESFTADATFTTLAPPDTTPPVISGIAVTGITTSQATVSWTTNEASTSYVDYGTTSAYGSTVGDASLVTSHSVTLTGLTASTVYHYRVRSADAASNEASSTDATFTTAAPPDTTPPVISNIQVINISSSGATVTWTTDEQATQFVDYGTTSAYGSTAGAASPLQTGHSVVLSGLANGTLYHYKVRSADAAGNVANSADATFTTLDTIPPVISNVQVTNITTTGATVTWTTNESSDSRVEYDTVAGPPYGSNQSSATMTTSHSIALTSLTPTTTYHYRVLSTDASGNQAASSDATFTTATPPDTTPPVISNIQVINITANSATITWTTDENSDSRVEYGTAAGPPYGSNQSSATMTTSHSIDLTGLTEKVVYHYRVLSTDASGNQAASSDATFTTLDVTAPAVTNVQVTNITENSATVTWTTNETANSAVDYGTTTSYGSTQSDAAYVTSHSIDLTGLTRSTTYHYQVRSADPSNNQTTTNDATFATIDTTPPVISNVQATNITSTGATITWTTDENSDSAVDYGTDTNYGSTQSDATATTSHSVAISGLAPDTTYHYIVHSTDASGNEATSTDQTFATPKPPAPVISNIQVSAITQTSATVSWTTDVSADSKVDYGLTTAYGNTRADSTAATSHSINLTGLAKNATYDFRVRSTGPYGQETASANQTFKTAADTTPPGNVTSFTAAPGNQSVSLSWTNPTDPDFVGTRVVRKAGSQPTGPTDGTQIYNGTGTSYVDTGLANGTTYYYGAFSYDDVPNYASGSFANATPAGPIDKTPPADISNFVATPGDQQNLLTWSLPNDPGWAGVQIQRSATGYPTSTTDGITVYNGNGDNHLDTGLVDGVTYFYRAFSFDGALNYTSGVEASGTPHAAKDTTPPGNVTNLAAAAGDGQVQLSWNNPSDADWAGTRVIRKEGSPPSSLSDGSIVFDGVGDSQLDTGVTNGTTYYYAAFAYDTSGNFSGATVVSATPKAGAKPPPPPSCTDTDGGQNYLVAGQVTAGGNVYQDSCTNATTVHENYCSGSSEASEDHDCGTGYKCSAGRCIASTKQAVMEYCGNGICGAGENSQSCPSDCPITPTTPAVQQKAPTVAPTQRLGAGDVKFYATKGRIELADNGGVVDAYTKMAMTVYLPDASIRKPLKTAYVNFNGSSYAMKPTHSYEALVTTPTSPGTYPLTVLVNYQDGTNDSVTVHIDAMDHGLVYENVNGQQQPVAGATVTLLVNQGGSYGVWDGGPSGQSNPQTSSDLGHYTFVVPNGTYKLRAEKQGYLTKETLPFPVNGQNVLTTALPLIKAPTNIQQAVSAASQVTVDQVKEITSNPIVKQQTQSAAPAVAAVAVANVASAGAATATAVPYLLYLYSFLAQPTLLIARRRRKKWGVVFNAITKEPVDLAIVRLVDATTGKIARSMVTDKEGRYFFIAKKGDYRITVAKAGFLFPTAYMKGQKTGVRYGDLYHGESIKVAGETTITANIPVDPVEKEKTPRRVLWEGILRRFQKSIGIISIAAMAVSAVITPTPLVLGLLVGNVLMYLVFRRLAVGKQPKNWGIVYDEKTKRPIQNAIVRVFEAKYNKLLETQVTDIRGRYAFLVGNNVYYVTYEKPGYQKQQKGPVDLMEVKDEAKQVIAEDVGLPKTEGGTETGTAKKQKASLLVPPSGKHVAPSVSKPALGEEVTEREQAVAAAEGTGAAPKRSLLVGPSGEKPAAEAVAPEKKEEGEKKAGIPWELRMLQGKGAEKPEGDEKAKENKTIKEEDKTEKSEIPWELQMLQGGKKDQGSAEAKKQEPAASAENKKEEGEKKAGIPWELRMLQGVKKAQGGEGGKEAEDAAGEKKVNGAKKEEPSKFPDVGDEKDIKTHPFPGLDARPIPSIQDVINAHPDIKLIEDEEHAHPEENKKDDNDEKHGPAPP